MSQGNGKASLTFSIYQGGELVRTETLSQDIIKVGKLPSSHLRIEDDNVSRMHAVIEVTSPSEVYIIDLGSASGTIVNGNKVNKSRLDHGDEITLGDTQVVVEVGALDDEATQVATLPEGLEDPMESAPTATATVPAPENTEAAPLSVPPPSLPPLGGAPSVPTPFAAAAAESVPNPFASAPPPAGLAPSFSDASFMDSEGVTYGIVASGPPVQADEVETGAQAVEVVVTWGDQSVLHVEHISPPTSWYVGDADAKGKPAPGVGYILGSDVLGTDRLPVVVEAGGGIAAVIPGGASGTVTVGDQTMTLAELRAAGRLSPCAELPGAEQYVVPQAGTARVEYRGFTFTTRSVSAGRKVVGSLGDAFVPLAGMAAYMAGVAALAIIFLVIMYFQPPGGMGLNVDYLDTQNRLVEYMMEPPETQEEETPEWLQDQADDREGGKGKRHKGEEGQMGKKEAQKTTNRYGIEGPEDNPDPHMAREEAREEARTAGILGVLQQMTGAVNSPTSPFGRDTALGNDPMSALGALMGDQIGENFGFGGLGLRGTGRGGGGTGEGTIGLGNLGTIGHGAGGGSGSGYGRGAGGFSGRSARVPQIRSGAADVRGSLSKEVIRRVIRRHINEVRFCYEQELNSRPDLEGRVTVSFIISPTGAVQSSTVAASTLGNQRVEGCIASAVRRWGFPQPEGGGIVVVNYPFMLTAAGG